MKIQHIFVLKETRAEESRVALTPEAVSLLKSPHYQLWVEAGAGLKAGFQDADYIQAGAELFVLSEEGFPADALILRVKRADPVRERLENTLFHENTCMMGFLDPFALGDHVVGWLKAGITTLSMDIVKSLSVDDLKNMQAAMSRIAGRLAFQHAMQHVKSTRPLKLTVIGTGPAAFNAVLEAAKTQIPIQVFGRQEKYRSQFEELGAIYYVIPEATDQIDFIQKHLSNQNLVICAARLAGKKAPLLLNEESLKTLPEGSAVVDLAASEGGSVMGSQCDQIVLSQGVFILHRSGYPKLEPKVASEAYSKCLLNLLLEILSASGEIFLDQELVKECCLTHQGAYFLADKSRLRDPNACIEDIISNTTH